MPDQTRPLPAPGYRPDIDGLRAIAVAAVVLGHAGTPGFAGGFIGVDIFFVLSGFLITAILRRDLGAQRFSLIQFYNRRARRILPALFAVLAASTLAAWAFMLPSASMDYGFSLLSVLLFVSNGYFWDVTGYFSPDALEMPLIHTWSLAVEEQFYLLFPLLIWALHRFARRVMLAALILLALASFWLCIWGSVNKPDVNYFFPLSRFWELLAGSLCTWVRPGRIAARLRSPLGLAGLGMLVVPITLFDAAVPYPSAWTALPILGTCLVILTGGQGGPADRLLSLRPVVWLGLISYSLYLWHQPFFAYARILRFDMDSPLVPALLIALSVALAAASWAYVERPFRLPHGPRVSHANPPRRALWLGLSSFSLLFAAGCVLALTPIHLGRFSEQDRALLGLSRKDASSYLHARAKGVTGAAFAEDGRPKVLVIGDSYSKDFLNILAETPAYAQVSLSFHQISGSCAAFMLPENTPGFPPEPFPPRCKGVDRYQSPGLLARMAQADVLILASAWQSWHVPFFAPSLENIRKTTDARIVILGLKAPILPDMPSLMRVAAADRPALRAPANPSPVATIAALVALDLPGYVNTQAILCPDAAGCPIVDEEGAPLSLDGSHLTPAGARYLSTRLFAAPALQGVFPGLPPDSP